MNENSNPVLCGCGCGEPVTVYYGKPRKFVMGHGRRGQRKRVWDPPNPSGICMCGCGGETAISPHTSRTEGYMKGQAKCFIQGHHPPVLLGEDDYVIGDRGYTTPCWVGVRNVISDKGYMRFARRNAHAVMYEQRVGPIPDGYVIDHLCRVRNCLRPDHLEAVPPAENVRRGLSAKMTHEIYETIFDLRENGWTHARIADELSLSRTTISKVLDGSMWSHLRTN